ncbi:MAG: CDP-alcohol phosphatidyltransferase family protein [Bacteroidia bacterium]|nr:CDP-alcohol phosphatidyltransferase family protein [Bacteroidia bacterium]
MAKFIDKSILTVPNLLSFYRIFSFPVVLYFALAKSESVYFILLLINLVTDVLDGFIARKFNLQSEFGARLDSFADIGMYILAFVGVICFKTKEIEPYMISSFIFLLFFVLPEIISFFKFRSFPSLHLYSSKIGGFIMGGFFFALFIVGFYPLFYYIMFVVGIVSFLEEIICVLVLSELKSNAKGLYWVLKDKRKLLLN